MARTGLAVGAAVVVVALLPTVSCSSRAPNEAPPAGSAPSQTVTPAPPLPSMTRETTLERQMRLDQEAAIRAYRTALAESARIYMSGGSQGVTDKMRSVATGSYLALVEKGTQIAQDEGWRLNQPGVLVFVAPMGWSTSAIHLKACEDNTGSRVVDDDHEDHSPPGERRYVQDYTVSRTARGWKVSDVDTKKVKSFENYGCGPQ